MKIGKKFLYNCVNFNKTIKLTDYLEFVDEDFMYNNIGYNKTLFIYDIDIDDVFAESDYSFSYSTDYPNAYNYDNGYIVRDKSSDKQQLKHIMVKFPIIDYDDNIHRMWGENFIFKIVKENGEEYINLNELNELYNLSTTNEAIILSGDFTIHKLTEPFLITFLRDVITDIPENFLIDCKILNGVLEFNSKVQSIKNNHLKNVIFNNTTIKYLNTNTMFIEDNYCLNIKKIKDIEYKTDNISIGDNFLNNSDFHGNLIFNGYKLIENT